MAFVVVETALVRRLIESMQDGLTSGGVARKGGWNGWQFCNDHLGIYESGRQEARVIRQALLKPTSGFRKEVLGLLISPSGRELWTEETS